MMVRPCRASARASDIAASVVPLLRRAPTMATRRPDSPAPLSATASPSTASMGTPVRLLIIPTDGRATGGANSRARPGPSDGAAAAVAGDVAVLATTSGAAKGPPATAGDPAAVTSATRGSDDDASTVSVETTEAPAPPLINWPVSRNPVARMNIPNAAIRTVGSFFGQDGVFERIPREITRASAEAAPIYRARSPPGICRDTIPTGRVAPWRPAPAPAIRHPASSRTPPAALS